MAKYRRKKCYTVDFCNIIGLLFEIEPRGDRKAILFIDVHKLAYNVYVNAQFFVTHFIIITLFVYYIYRKEFHIPIRSYFPLYVENLM